MTISPRLLASYLSAVNRVRRWSGGSPRIAVTILVAALLVVLFGIAGIGAIVGARTSVVAWLTAHTVLLAVAAGVHFFLAILRARGHLALERERSWLAALPETRGERWTVSAVRIVGPTFLQMALLIIGLGAMTFAAGLALSAAAVLVSWPVGGGVVGFLFGGLWRQRAEGQRREDSRYIPRPRAGSLKPSLAGLSRWPIAQAIAWHRPENSRALFIIAALSVPLGSSAMLGLAIVAFWTLVSYMTALLAATQRVAREASLWLRATPLDFASFAWALVRRVLLHQAMGGALAAVVLLIMHASAVAVVYLYAAWLVVAAAAAAIGAAEAYRARAPGWRVALCLGAALGIESRAHGWGLSLAVALAIAHVRGAMKHVHA